MLPRTSGAGGNQRDYHAMAICLDWYLTGVSPSQTETGAKKPTVLLLAERPNLSLPHSLPSSFKGLLYKHRTQQELSPRFYPGLFLKPHETAALCKTCVKLVRAEPACPPNGQTTLLINYPCSGRGEHWLICRVAVQTAAADKGLGPF